MPSGLFMSSCASFPPIFHTRVRVFLLKHHPYLISAPLFNSCAFKSPNSLGWLPWLGMLSHLPTSPCHLSLMFPEHLTILHFFQFLEPYSFTFRPLPAFPFAWNTHSFLLCLNDSDTVLSYQVKYICFRMHSLTSTGYMI